MSKEIPKISLKLIRAAIDTLESALEEADLLNSKVESEDDRNTAVLSYSKAVGVALSAVDEANALVQDIKVQQQLMLNPTMKNATDMLEKALGLATVKQPKSSRSN